MNVVALYREMTAKPPEGDPAISLGETAKPATELAPHAHFDACATWLELAIHHLSDAQVAQDARVAAWKGADESAKAGALQWEFEASMQAIVAAGIAIDAFYAAVRPKVKLTQLLVEKWQEERMPRSVQISEVLCRVLSLEARAAGALRQNLGEIFRFRDLAVDPSRKSDAPVLHPDLRVAVEWRFAYFTGDNALMIVTATLRLLREILVLGKAQDAEVQAYVVALRSSVELLQNSSAFRARTHREQPRSES